MGFIHTLLINHEHLSSFCGPHKIVRGSQVADPYLRIIIKNKNTCLITGNK